MEGIENLKNEISSMESFYRDDLKSLALSIKKVDQSNDSLEDKLNDLKNVAVMHSDIFREYLIKLEQYSPDLPFRSVEQNLLNKFIISIYNFLEINNYLYARFEDNSFGLLKDDLIYRGNDMFDKYLKLCNNLKVELK